MKTDEIKPKFTVWTRDDSPWAANRDAWHMLDDITTVIIGTENHQYTIVANDDGTIRIDEVKF